MFGPATTENVLAMFTIYDHPRDYPNCFVVRRWVIEDGRQVPCEMALAMTLEQARALIPPGVFNIGRVPEDNPVIVETWI